MVERNEDALKKKNKKIYLHLAGLQFVCGMENGNREKRKQITNKQVRM